MLQADGGQQGDQRNDRREIAGFDVDRGVDGDEADRDAPQRAQPPGAAGEPGADQGGEADGGADEAGDDVEQDEQGGGRVAVTDAGPEDVQPVEAGARPAGVGGQRAERVHRLERHGEVFVADGADGGGEHRQGMVRPGGRIGGGGGGGDARRGPAGGAELALQVVHPVHAARAGEGGAGETLERGVGAEHVGMAGQQGQDRLQHDDLAAGGQHRAGTAGDVPGDQAGGGERGRSEKQE